MAVQNLLRSEAISNVSTSMFAQSSIARRFSKYTSRKTVYIVFWGRNRAYRAQLLSDQIARKIAAISGHFVRKISNTFITGIHGNYLPLPVPREDPKDAVGILAGITPYPFASYSLDKFREPLVNQ